ncbi:MAG: formyl transferase [Anaerolineae bacterium]|jgi:methionyl-tRNA formyltransferase|nr:formyl transferase [Chloroflexota bacterium]MBV6435332.1 Methionyl-tRNA formyltransferase [Anaerolineae bacterium]MCO6445880.1 formyl transferase [Anaerolineae bacterium]MDL1917042.1 formyl transferase [Anaerolineae bacterium CFX4]GIK27090.1 MAG: formyl transferase [Chloroflexota bacterium]
MKIVYLANGFLGYTILEWLKQQQDTSVVGLVVHPPERRRYGDEMIADANLPDYRVFDGSTINSDATISAIKELDADLGVSIMFGYILRPDILSVFRHGVINLHPSYLPYNRGAYPNVWSIIEETPAGVTLHYIDQSIDTGDIIAQTRVNIEPVDTGATLYSKLEKAAYELFTTQWPRIIAGTASRTIQPRGGTSHRVRDVETIDQIDLDRSYTGRELINLLRARTFPPYLGAYFIHEGKKVYVSIELRYNDEDE